MGSVAGFRVLMGLVMALGSGVACNPFDAFAECDYQNITLDEVDVDVDAKSEALLGEYPGTLTWTRTGDTTSVLVSIARSDDPITAESDCDGNLDGFEVPLALSVTSDDRLVAIEGGGPVARLDEHGEVESIPTAVGGPVSFDALKAAGITPPEWISNFFPVLMIPLSAPGATPQDGNISVEHGTSDKPMTTVLAEITFP
jgi:hypothetical protein